jgi:hypothetical protein
MSNPPKRWCRALPNQFPPPGAAANIKNVTITVREIPGKLSIPFDREGVTVKASSSAIGCGMFSGYNRPLPIAPSDFPVGLASAGSEYATSVAADLKRAQ